MSSVSLQQVARQVGVSGCTASKVLNGKAQKEAQWQAVPLITAQAHTAGVTPGSKS